MSPHREPSHLGALVRFAGERWRGRNAAERRSVARPEVTVSALTAPEGRVRRYLRATGGDSIEALRALDVLPPVYPAIWETAVLIDLLRIAGLPFPSGGVIHLGSERLYVRPASARDAHTLTVRQERIEAVRRGARLTVAMRLSTASGLLCQEGEIHLLLPGVVAGRARPTAPAVEGSDGDGRAWRDLASWSLRPRDARRYAWVSGDLNPVHLSWLTARLLGFRGAILHGFCTEARVGHALVERLFGGDPTRLRRLRTRFPAPLVLPARVVLRVADGDTPATGIFRVVDTLPDSRPFAEGEFVFGRSGVE